MKKKLNFPSLFDAKHLKMSPRQLVEERAFLYSKKYLRPMKVKSGIHLGNGQCYYNSRHFLEVGDSYNITACIAFGPDGRGANLHFVNTVGKNYVDNTLGYRAKFHKYYFVRDYSKKDLASDKSNKIFVALADYFLNLWFTQEERDLFKISREAF